VAQPPTYLIADDRAADVLADDEADADGLTRSGTRVSREMDDQRGSPRARTGPHDSAELRAVTEACSGWEHWRGAGEVSAGQADRALRPLRRRAEMIARPARVRIRSRKPCVRARRRLFGW
jgi:hypothetical protein